MEIKVMAMTVSVLAFLAIRCAKSVDTPQTVAGGESSPPGVVEPSADPSGPAPATEAPPAPTEQKPAGDRICCESFGYGAMMVECCQETAWTTAEECTVKAGHVGGGKRIVDGSKCPKPE